MKKLKSREKELSSIYRYNGSANTMFYRPNLLMHSKRVSWLTKEICKKLEKLGLDFDKNLAIELAKVHDDTEIITGDIVATKKERWTNKQIKEYEKECDNAIDIVYENYKDLFKNYDYKKLLKLEETRNSKEFFIIKYADRLDAHLECIHEIYGGNKEFVDKKIKITKGFINKYKDFIRFPYNLDSFEMNFFMFTHVKMSMDLHNLCKSFSIDLKDLEKSDIFNLSKNLNIYDKFKNYREHTLENLKGNKNYYLYNLWINSHFKYGNKKDIEELYLKKEKNIVYM